ncbi:MAG TPA: HlyD family efflux transporter periplasmic adaptor subunit [Afifellaceae bacterium]|nr:HlyD family efflux transporter periplasmic adaptor subunit [Afifellaceae bacterium]
MNSILCAIPIVSALIADCAPPPPLAVGYVEGEYVLIAPIETAQIVSVDVSRGSRIAAGERLATLERRDAEIAVAEARAALAQAESKLADLRQGKRPEEIDMIVASINSARAQAEEAQRALDRQTDLLKRGVSAQANFDTASTNLQVARAKVAELEANLAVAKLPARADEIDAAEATVKQAEASLANARWRLDQRELTAPEPGTVFDIIRNPGEVAGPQAPVLSVLPDGAVKVRVYIPERALAGISTGTRLEVHCDGCGEGMTATVSYVANDPEFTPPVIYSLENRQKLVYLVEAKPDDGAVALKPGQIVDVSIAGANE